jgi:hypothetical protein
MFKITYRSSLVESKKKSTKVFQLRVRAKINARFQIRLEHFINIEKLIYFDKGTSLM